MQVCQHPTSTLRTVRANSNGATLQPGNYKNGLNLKGNQTLSPGTYIVSGGSFSVNANANIIGNGVTIYLAPGVSVSINGNAKMTLSAPTSGDYAGMLFFGDRTATGDVKLNGTADSLFTGNIYFKNQAFNTSETSLARVAARGSWPIRSTGPAMQQSVRTVPPME